MIFRIAPLLALLVMVPFICQCTSSSADDAPPKSWTILVYLDGDTTLERDFIGSFLDMAQYGSDANINLVVQFDRSPDYDDQYGDWTIAHRFYITRGMTPVEGVAIQDWGDGEGGREVDMADPMTLASFINWGMHHWPAQKYAVVVADHGTAWQGMCLDETSGDYWMYLTELKQAFEAAAQNVTLIGLDACLMATMDAAWQLKDVGADVMVGSEASGRAWPWDLILAEWVKNPGWDAGQAGAWMVKSYHRHWVVDQKEDDMTLAALDLAEAAELGKRTAAFSETALAGADFTAIRDAARSVREQVDRTVIESLASPNRTDAHGVTVYFPESRGGMIIELPDNYAFYTGKLVPFAKQASWRPLLTGTLMPLGSKLDPRILDARDQINLTFEGGAFVDLAHYMDTLMNQ
jgi:hypothetical protein